MTLHDWWAYLLVTPAGGAVVADDKRPCLYRQHATNAVGVPLSPARRGWAALRRGPHVFMRTFRAHMEALAAQPELLSPVGARGAGADFRAGCTMGGAGGYGRCAIRA